VGALLLPLPASQKPTPHFTTTKQPFFWGARERCAVVDFVAQIEVFKAKFCVTCRLAFGWPCRMFLTLELTATGEEMRAAGFSV
jgi:hypothetical protein